MLKNFLHLLEKITGLLLGSLAVSVEVGNVLVCIVMILAGPAILLGLPGQ